MKNKKKCIIMLSGGLDSRLALKIMQEQGFDCICLFFKLPFGSGCCHEGCSFNFAQTQRAKLEFFDCTKGKLLKEYLEVLKAPKFGRGKGINPCIDCRIFMLKKAKEYASSKKIDLIVTGEVFNERPMSQHGKALRIIEEESGLIGRLLRPLSAKLLKETEAEKEGLVNREKLYSINGRRRTTQIEIANKFGISYPDPGGGCLLCEKKLKERFEYLIKKNLIDDKTLALARIGRHFLIKGTWFVVGRDETESNAIEILELKNHILESGKNKPAVYFNKTGKIAKEKALELQGVFSSGTHCSVYTLKGTSPKVLNAGAKEKDRKSFDGWKL